MFDQDEPSRPLWHIEASYHLVSTAVDDLLYFTQYSIIVFGSFLVAIDSRWLDLTYSTGRGIGIPSHTLVE